MAKIVGKPNADDVKRVAVAALVAALDDSKEHARKNPRLTGVRAVATGAVLYTAGKAALNGRRFVNEHLRNGSGEPEEDDDVYEDDDDPAEAEEVDGEPVAEEDEDFDEDDEDFDDAEEAEEEDEEEPVAEEEEDFDEDDDEDLEEDDDEDPEEDEDEDEDVEERSAASEPPVHPDDEDIDEADLPERPSKRRQPVGRR